MAVVGFKYVIVGSAVNKARFSVWRAPPKESTDSPPQEKVSAVGDHMTSSFWRRTWEFIKKDSQLQEENSELQLDVEMYRALAKQKDRDLRQYKRWYDKTEGRHKQVLKESELFYKTSQELKQQVKQLHATLQQHGIPWLPLQKDGEQHQQQQQQLVGMSSSISSSSVDVAAWRHRSRSSDADSAAEAAELVKLQKQRQADKVECLAAKQEAARLRAALAEAQNTIQHLQQTIARARARHARKHCLQGSEPSFTAGSRGSRSSSSAQGQGTSHTAQPATSCRSDDHGTYCMVTANSTSISGSSSGSGVGANIPNASLACLKQQASWSSFTQVPDLPSFSFQGAAPAAAAVNKCSSRPPASVGNHCAQCDVNCDYVI